MTNSLTIHTANDVAVTLSPALDARIVRVSMTVAYARNEADRASLVSELRAWGVSAAPTYVRVA